MRGTRDIRLICVLFAALITFPASAQRGVPPGTLLFSTNPPWQRIHLPDSRPFNPAEDEDLRALIALLEKRIAQAEEQEKEFKAWRKEWRGDASLDEMSQDGLFRYFHPPDKQIGARELRGYEELRRLAQATLGSSGEERAALQQWLCEVAAATANNRRSPALEHVEFLQIPLLHWKYLYGPVGKGTTIAANIAVTNRLTADTSRVDPPDSSFWKLPAFIPSADLFQGFGRDAVPDYANLKWKYDEPKLSYGGNGGFEVKSGDIKLKVKFGEVNSEPFIARVFAALGYNVDPTDHAPGIRIKYDRRLLREFHLRKPVDVNIRLLRVLPVATLHLQKRHDPFGAIGHAVMKDASVLTGLQLKQRLLRDPEKKNPADDPANFIPEVEEQIDHLVTVPANVQVNDKRVHSIGPWDFGELGHEDLRELRGLALLAAWLGWFDSRFENTRLKTIGTGESRELRHYLTDLGGGLGRPFGLILRKYEAPNDLPWTFTRPPRVQGPGRMTIPFRIVEFQPIELTESFRDMTRDDARWMGRLIGRLTEQQLVEGLVASGFDSAEVRLLTEKLVNRRDQMIRDLGLANEISLLRPEGVDRKFSYDPALDGPVRITTADGREIVAPIAGQVIADGWLTNDPDPQAAINRSQPAPVESDCIHSTPAGRSSPAAARRAVFQR